MFQVNAMPSSARQSSLLRSASASTTTSMLKKMSIASSSDLGSIMDTSGPSKDAATMHISHICEAVLEEVSMTMRKMTKEPDEILGTLTVFVICCACNIWHVAVDASRTLTAMIEMMQYQSIVQVGGRGANAWKRRPMTTI